MTHLFLPLVHLLILRASVASAEYYAPGQASWLGYSGEGSGTPLNYEDYLPYTYVVFALDSVPLIRSIVAIDSECPQPETAVAGPTPMKTRFLGNPIDSNMMPYKFPVHICEYRAESAHERFALDNGFMTVSYRGQSFAIPQVKTDPQKYMLVGDTGLRLKPTNLGLGKLGDPPCNGTKVYGINQCLENFTASDLDNQSQAGSFQGLDEWHFADIASSAASKNVDVVVYVGDYLYRQGACPLFNKDSLDGKQKDCSAVNLPSFATADDIVDGTTMNFIPGLYGDNWWGWWADFFYPAMELLKAAPLIPTRGNHEVCTRGGYGYFMFLYPGDIQDYCAENTEPYAVSFESEQFLVMDDSIISPLNEGVDHFKAGQCPGPPASGYIVPVQEDRNDDPTDRNIEDQIDTFTKHFETIEELSQSHSTNFYVGHRPIFGIGCNNGTYVTLDWTLQQSLGETTLNFISGIITGHMHWLEVLQFEDDKLPPQMVVGHGGTQLIRNYVNQSAMPFLRLEVGKPEYNITGTVERGLTESNFGYGIMERTAAGDYEVTFHNLVNSSGGKISFEPIPFSLLIPKGPRIPGDTSISDAGDSRTTSSGPALSKSKAVGCVVGIALLFAFHTAI